MPNVRDVGQLYTHFFSEASKNSPLSRPETFAQELELGKRINIQPGKSVASSELDSTGSSMVPLFKSGTTIKAWNDETNSHEINQSIEILFCKICMTV